MTSIRVRLRDSFLDLSIPEGWDTWTSQGYVFRRTSTGRIGYLDGSQWWPVQVLEIAA